MLRSVLLLISQLIASNFVLKWQLLNVMLYVISCQAKSTDQKYVYKSTDWLAGRAVGLCLPRKDKSWKFAVAIINNLCWVYIGFKLLSMRSLIRWDRLEIPLWDWCKTKNLPAGQCQLLHTSQTVDNIVVMRAYSSKVNIYLYWGISVAECNAVCVTFCKR